MDWQKRQSVKCNLYLTTGQKCTHKDQIKRAFKSEHAAQSIIDHMAHYGKFGVKELPWATGITDESIHIMSDQPITPCYRELSTCSTLAQRFMYLSWNENQSACRFWRENGLLSNRIDTSACWQFWLEIMVGVWLRWYFGFSVSFFNPNVTELFIAYWLLWHKCWD